MIDELKRFLMVAEEGNLTRTAEKIFITQSALTQSIHRLENHLNTKLLKLHGKQLQVTEDGKALVLIGNKILQLWKNAHDPQIRKVHIPTYAIGLFDNAALRLGSFFQKNMQAEQYKLELTIGSSGTLLHQLQLGTLDAALCVLNNTYITPNHLTLLYTFTEKLIPVSAKIFLGKDPSLPYILYNRGSHTRLQIDAVFQQNGIAPTIFAESTSVTFMRELAVLGCGIALLPENFVKNDLDQGSLKKQQMPLQWAREYGLFIQKNSDIAQEKQLISQIQSALEN